MDKDDARALSNEALEQMRKQAVRLQRRGEFNTAIAEILGVNRRTVGIWLQRYAAAGARALQGKRRGRKVGEQRTLTPAQEAEAQHLLVDKSPDQLKLTFARWSGQAVRELLRVRFGVAMPIRTVGLYLHRWGFTPQKPVRRAYERDPAAIQRWLAEQYPAIQAAAKADLCFGRTRRAAGDCRVLQEAYGEGRYIVFVDETGFMMEPLVRRTWAPRGKTPEIRVTTPHARISGIGAMTIRRVPLHFGFHFHLLPDNLNFQGHSVAAFLTQLCHRLHGGITVIWDEIPIHRARPVQEFLAKHPNMQIEEFPPYAPELNPVHYVWSYVKYARLANCCPADLLELRNIVVAELTRVKRSPRLLRSLFSGAGLTLNGFE
jgi:transposase